MNKHIKEENVDVSVIIPFLNQQSYIKGVVRNILKEITDSLSIEILLIDDGSTDDSASVCKELSAQYKQIKYLYQENAGVSAARNYGINNAKGKYLFFLDADDSLEYGTIHKIKVFFDSVYDEVDLVTYRIDTIYKDSILKPHFRYRYLKESGVYDLREHAYIGQTTMNIVVKNRFADNILFDEQQTFSEDQKYCCEVLKDKLKMGYCAEGRYLYYRNENSASGRLSGACYIFEQCTDFFEGLFEQYEEVPLAFQGLFVNDFYWKLQCNILFPYHYDNEKYKAAIGRLQKLLSKCDASVILNHPQIDFFEKYYMLRMKNKKELEYKISDTGFGLFSNEICTVYENSVEIVMTKFHVSGEKIIMHGFLKSVFFQFYEKLPMLCVAENDGKLVRKLTLRESVHNYYLSHEKTQRFWAFSYECNINEVYNFAFEMEVGGKWFPVHYYYMPGVPFSHKYKRYAYTYNNVKITIDKENHFHINAIKKKAEKPLIWLYYDCVGVECDNGMLQFLNDYDKKDGVKRYYVVSDERQKKYLPKGSHFVKWGDKKHKNLFRNCHKIMTAYIEDSNIIPFARADYERYAGDFHFEVVYLQHGVLHIDMPWKYSPERILADRIVVSTKQEAELFIRNGFTENNLIKCRMPRLAVRNCKKTQNRRIMFAPSWRAYLVGGYVNRQWTRLDGRFLASTYYKQINNLLNSRLLNDFLEEADYTLEMKLHPIFAVYKEYFKTDSSRIHIVDTPDKPENYEIFITDISSYAYDYMFQGVRVFWFLPDIDEFKAGMNGYRNMGAKDYWKNVTTEPEFLVEKLRKYVEDGIYEGLEADFFENGLPTEYIYMSNVT